jgi:hypothetical protein
MKTVSVDIQGFNLKIKSYKWEFYPKEISTYDGCCLENYLLKPSTPFSELSSINKKQVRYDEEKIHGIRYSDGDIDSNDIQHILSEALKNYDVVYVKGHQKYEYLKQILPHLEIKNIENEEDAPKFIKRSAKFFGRNNDGQKWCDGITNCIILQHGVEKNVNNISNNNTSL